MNKTTSASKLLENSELGHRVRFLRKRCGLSLRQIAAEAQVTPSMISCIERGKASPSITVLQKILWALGSDLATFFTDNQEDQEDQEGPFYQRQSMRTISDKDRTYTIIFPKRQEIAVEMLDEHIAPGKGLPSFERLQCDIAGYILTGTLTLEIHGSKKETLRPGDAFYIPKGSEHRGFAATDKTVHLITVYYPNKY